MPLLEAALEGAKIRLRPILMTSFAFHPRLRSALAGQRFGRRGPQGVMGTTVIGGMLAASLLAIFLIPVTFYVVERLAGGKKAAIAPPPGGSGPPAGH